MKKVLIAVPTDKYIEAKTFKSIYEQEVPPGVVCDFKYFIGRDIDQVRESIAKEVLRAYDYLFSVDSDIILPKNALKTLLEEDLAIVSGVYVQRNNKNLTELYKDVGGGKQINIPAEEALNAKHGLYEVSAAGFGCILIDMGVFNSSPAPYFHYHVGRTLEETVSEDVYFCNKIRRLQFHDTDNRFKIFVNNSVICHHIGEQIFIPTNKKETAINN